jgi:ADP-heptose:LPS heptosyltransferase
VKVLIVRFSSIGDIVLTSPVIRCIRQQSGAEVHFLTRERYKDILSHNPHLAKVYTIRERVNEVIGALRGERYDAVIDLHNNLRSWQLRLSLPGVAGYGFDKRNLQKWLMVRTKSTVPPVGHIVARYLEAAAPLGVQDDRQGLEYFIPPGQEVDLEAVAQLFPSAGESQLLVRQGQFYAFAIGAAHATKRLPWEKIAEICRCLDLPVILLGGAQDAGAAQRIISNCPTLVADGCGKFTLHQSASIVRQSFRVITHDTGLMHIAAALRKAVISVWGSTVPAFGMTPYYPAEVQVYERMFEVKGLNCRPCSKIGFDRCPKGHFRCMNDIPAREVADAAMRRL